MGSKRKDDRSVTEQMNDAIASEPLVVTSLGQAVVAANQLGVLSDEALDDPELADGLTYTGGAMFSAQVRGYGGGADTPPERVLAIFIADPAGPGDGSVRWSGEATPVVELSVDHARKLRDLLVVATIRGAL